MKAIINFIRNEPAMVVSVILAALGLFVNLDQGQKDAVTNIVQSIVILLGGAVVRQSVTPLSKANPTNPGGGTLPR